MDKIKITLETLYDILRNEKKREDLQRLEDSFFIDVVSYFREKKAFLEVKKDSDNPFASGEKDKLEYELRSIKRILKEIYEKREKKIIDIALNRSRTGSDIIDTSAMLKEEKEFYEKILEILDSYRGWILLNLSRGELPGTEMLKSEPATSNVEQKSDEDELKQKAGQPQTFSKFEGAPPLAAEETAQEEKVKIKIIHPMPSFVWKDMKIYGPYEEGEEIEMFPEVAELMIRKRRAERA